MQLMSSARRRTDGSRTVSELRPSPHTLTTLRSSLQACWKKQSSTTSHPSCGWLRRGYGTTRTEPRRSGGSIPHGCLRACVRACVCAVPFRAARLPAVRSVCRADGVSSDWCGTRRQRRGKGEAAQPVLPKHKEHVATPVPSVGFFSLDPRHAQSPPSSRCLSCGGAFAVRLGPSASWKPGRSLRVEWRSCLVVRLLGRWPWTSSGG